LAGLAVGRTSGVLRERRGGSVGPERYRGLLREGRTWIPALSPANDGQGSGVRVLCRCVLVAKVAEALAGGCGIPGVGGGQRTGFSHSVRLSQAAPGNAAALV